MVSNLINHPLLAQESYFTKPVTIEHQGDTLGDPLTGGFNNPQFYTLDLMNDGVDDLVVFDRTGGTWTLFTRDCTNDCQWQHNRDTALNQIFPDTEHWAYFARQPCMDDHFLFTAHKNNYISVYRLTSQPNSTPTITRIIDTLHFNDDQAEKPVYVNQIDIPGFADVDNDGDVDILTFAPDGGFLEWFRNESGSCDDFAMVRADKCFGEFFESGITREVTLDTCTTGLWNGGYQDGLHSGSTVMPIDYDNNGLMDVVLGDLNFHNLNLLQNDGSLQDAHFFTQDIAFPSNSTPVDIRQFPGSFLLDVDGDGHNDVVAAPNSRNNSIDVQTNWYYKNQATDGSYQLQLEQQDWLLDETIDWGSHIYPAALDVNGDGLEDLLLGTGQTIGIDNEMPGRLILYKRTSAGDTVSFRLADSNFANLRKYDFNDIAVAFGDLNGDSLPDMVVGEGSGKLFYAYNTGTEDTAIFGDIAPFSPAIDIGNNAAPTLGDLNGDGLMDLVVGERNGNLNYFENKGTAQNPTFTADPDNDFFGEVDTREPGSLTGYSTPKLIREIGAWVLYTGNLAGKIEKYENIEGNLQGAFDKVNPQGQGLLLSDINEGDRSAPLPIRLDQDAATDLVIGNARGGINLLFGSGESVGMQPAEQTQEIKIAPNPAHDFIKVLHSFSEPAHVSIHDMQGRLIRLEHVSSTNPIHMEIRNIPDGTYILTLQGTRSAANQLLIVKQ